MNILNLPNSIDIETCGQCTIKLNQVDPEGTETPDWYFLGEAPGEQEALEHRPFVGDSGIILRTLIHDAGIDNSRIRIGNTVACRPTNDEGYNRTPDESEVRRCFTNFATQDILRTKPKMIVCVGGVAMRALFPTLGKFSITAARNETDLSWNGIPVRVIFHPSYILRSGGESSPNYTLTFNDLKKIKSFVDGEEKVDQTSKTQKLIITQERLAECLKLVDDSIVYLDFETTWCSPYDSRFEMCEIGICGSRYAITIRIKDPDGDHGLSESNRKLLKDFLLSRKSVKVFNVGFELPAGIHALDIDLSDNIYDVMQACRALNWNGSLKEISSRILGVQDWSSVLDHWVDDLNSLVELLTKQQKKLDYLIEVLDKNRSLYDTFDLLQKQIKDVISRSTGEFSENKEYKWCSNICNSFLKVLTHLENLYGFNVERLRKYEVFLCDVIIRKIQKKETWFDYTELPYELVAPYNGDDIINTRELDKVVEKQLELKGCKEAADLYNEHMKLAVEIESAGIAWDDQKAEELSKVYISKGLDALKNLLVNTTLTPHLNLSDADKLKILSSTDENELVGFFNPRSTHITTRQKFSQAILTPQLKVAYAIYLIKSNPKNYQKLLNNKSSFTFLRQFVADGSEQVTKYKELLQIVLSGTGPQLNWDDRQIIDKASDMSLEDMAAGTIEMLYELMSKFMGVDPNKKETWTPEFTLMYYFRLFKKVSKAKSAYISGKMGRSQVYTINKSDIDKQIPPRTCQYWDLKDLKKSDSELFILQPSFRVNEAKTKRWTSFIHTIPWGAELRDIHISRYENGILGHYDYSQNEIKVLAFMSGDQALINAVKSGLDVHRYIASRVWRKDPKDVSDAERRYAKMAVFSIVFGKTEEGFANEFVNGDLELATKIFSDFFREFPGVKKYIEQKHKEFMESGEVKTLFGDTIIIDVDRFSPYDGVVNQGKRQSQNYPIQSSASTVAGVCFYRITKELKSYQLGTKTVDFQHDSSTFDTRGRVLPKILRILPVLAEEQPLKLWGVPVTIDIAIGVRGNSLIELEDTEVHPEDSGFKSKFDGVSSDLEQLCDTLKKNGFKTDVTITSETTKYIDMKELFITRRAYSMYIGTERKSCKGVINVTS